ncbi:MAG: substrate-binding domain-containing protein [Verrucomicrobia bacterium]|nr:substrate-binding domain-containing protein [Verrucomicrobiota bacterium]
MSKALQIKRREALTSAGAVALGMTFAGCEESAVKPTPVSVPIHRSNSDDEYVWLSANANLPMFAEQDQPALRQAGAELGVKVTVAGPNSIDIPSLLAAIEQTTARRPAGMMIVGWDPSGLVGPINAAIEAGIPVVCVDADVPASKRMAFIGTDWFDIGVQQARAMLKALGTRRGKVALLGLIEQTIDQQAFAGFRSVAEPAGLVCLPPQQDKGNQAEATRVAASIIQGTPDLAGMAGFDSESGPGIGQAIKEAGKVGQIIGTTVQAEGQMLKFIMDGVMTASVMQKRKLFTYYGVKALYDLNHSKLRFTADDRKAGITPIPINYSTGTFLITKENVAMFVTG